MVLPEKDMPDQPSQHRARIFYAELPIIELRAILTASLAILRDNLRAITAWIIAIESTVPRNSPQPVIDFWEEMNKFTTFVKSAILNQIRVVNKFLIERFAILDLSDNDLWTREIVPLFLDLRTSLDDVYLRIPVLTTQLECYS
jgi:hypothetical protein